MAKKKKRREGVNAKAKKRERIAKKELFSINVGKVGALGLLDTKDNLWLGVGPNGGVKTFDDEKIAQIAARMADVQLGWSTGR
jgi:hypothetical protein